MSRKDAAFGGYSSSCLVSKNQTFTVTPAGAATLEFVLTAAEADTADDRAFTITGLDDTEVYDLFLLEASDLTDESFVDDDDNDVAVVNAAVAADIDVVNNGTVTDTDLVDDQAPVNGTITVTIDGDAAGSAVLVVVEDDGVDDDIELDANGVPTSPFGLSGVTSFVAPEADATATSDNGRVESLDKDANEIGVDLDNAGVGDFDAAGVDIRYFYDSNDSFEIGGIPVTFAAFEAALSRGDALTVDVYTQDDSLESQFNLNADSPTLASATATPDDLDVDVVIASTAPVDEGLYDTFTISRSVDDGVTADADKTYTEVGTITGAEYAADGFTDTTPEADDYTYSVVGTIDGDTSDAVYADATTTDPAADTDAPVSESTRLVTNAGFAADIDTGDEFRFIFDEEMDLAANASIRFTTAGGTENWQLTNGVNATLTLNAAEVTFTGSDAGTYDANHVLTVNVLANPTPILGTVAADLPAQYDLTVTTSAGVTDTAGNNWDTAGSGIAAVAATLTNQGITWTADTAGAAGNDISIAFVVAGASTPLSVSVTGTDIVVNLETDAGSAAISTTLEVQTKVNGHATAGGLVTGSGGDATVAAALAATDLTGGADAISG